MRNYEMRNYEIAREIFEQVRSYYEYSVAVNVGGEWIYGVESLDNESLIMQIVNVLQDAENGFDSVD